MKLLFAIFFIVFRKNQHVPADETLYLRKRYYVSALAFLGLVLNFLLRINVSICIVDMTSNKTVTINDVTHTEVSETPPIHFILSENICYFIFNEIFLACRI